MHPASASPGWPAGGRPYNEPPYREPQYQEGYQDAIFDGMDRNGDGVITRAEYLAAPAFARSPTRSPAPSRDSRISASRQDAMFAALDRNNDGVISRSEWLNRPQSFSSQPVSSREEAMFNALDRNHDGVITRAEWLKQPSQEDVMFSAVDRDGDGVISRSEWRNRPAWADASSFSQASQQSLCRGPNLIQVHAGTDSGKVLLSCSADGAVDLQARDDGSGRQRWNFVNIGGGMYNIFIAGGTRPDKICLSCGADGHVYLCSQDDGSGRQRWLLDAAGSGKYRINVAGGTTDARTFLSCSADGHVFLYSHDDGSGRQAWGIAAADSQEAMFDAIDRNHDGVITRSEWLNRSQTPSPPSVTPAKSGPSTTHCNNGHELQLFVIPKGCGAACNVCGRTLDQGKRTMGCRSCNYDVCDLCNTQGPSKSAYSSLGKKPMRLLDMRSARDIIQEDMMSDTFWLFHCLFGGIGCLQPGAHGCCLEIGECLCCAGTCKSAYFCDEDGCLASTCKISCCLFHGEIPPSNTPGFACGPVSVGGNLYRRGAELLSGNEKEELELLRTTLWCCFLYFCGLGYVPPTSNIPFFKAEGKLCCIWTNLETRSSYDPLLAATAKVCCCVVDGQIPADRNAGCITCGRWKRKNMSRPPDPSLTVAPHPAAE